MMYNVCIIYWIHLESEETYTKQYNPLHPLLLVKGKPSINPASLSTLPIRCK